jgi:hypothetical protein
MRTAHARRPEPVLIWTAILATAQIIVGGAAFADVIGPRWAALAVLIVGALQVGTGVYLRGVVTPVSDPMDNHGNRLVPGQPEGSAAPGLGAGRT